MLSKNIITSTQLQWQRPFLLLYQIISVYLITQIKSSLEVLESSTRKFYALLSGYSALEFALL